MKKAYERVLIVEDDSDLRNLLESIITQRVKYVMSSDNLATAQVMIAANKPDLILLDNNLPDGQGIERIKYFKALSPDTDLILVSAMPNLKEEAMKFGADWYIEKPLRISDIYSLIQKQAS